MLLAEADEDSDNVVITAEIIGGDHGPVTLDDDGILVARIKNTGQKVKFTMTTDGVNTVEKTLNLTGLTLQNS